jgi:ABC-type transport system substrate-binding protein
VNAVTTMVSQLEDFGIKAQMETVETSTYWSKTMPEGDFTAAVSTWSFWQPYPWYQFRLQFLPAGQIDTQFGIKNNVPAELEVPMPVGKPSGSTETVKPRELIDKLSVATTKEEETRLIRKLAWTFNQTMPLLPIRTKTSLSGGSWDTGSWEFPDSIPVMDSQYAESAEDVDSEIRKDMRVFTDTPVSSFQYMVRNGLVQAKGE